MCSVFTDHIIFDNHPNTLAKCRNILFTEPRGKQYFDMFHKKICNNNSSSYFTVVYNLSDNFKSVEFL